MFPAYDLARYWFERFNEIFFIRLRMKTKVLHNRYETRRFIRVAVPVGTSSSARLKNQHRRRKRTRKLVQSYSGHGPWATPGREGRPHRCEMHLIYVRKLPINWRNRHVYENEIARHVASRHVTSRRLREVTEMREVIGPEARRMHAKVQIGSGRRMTTLLSTKNENDAKTTAVDLTRGETARRRIRERNERCATIKPECRGAPRPRETPKFSSIFLSQEGRVGAKDAFAIRTILL